LTVARDGARHPGYSFPSLAAVQSKETSTNEAMPRIFALLAASLLSAADAGDVYGYKANG
jgi:hypothetical protein